MTIMIMIMVMLIIIIITIIIIIVIVIIIITIIIFQHWINCSRPTRPRWNLKCFSCYWGATTSQTEVVGNHTLYKML